MMRLLVLFLSMSSLLFGAPRVLYVMETKEGVFDAHAGSGSYATLVMNQIGTAVAYFSEEPKGGTLSVEDFILLWQKGATKFHPIPPVTSMIDGKGDHHLVELRNPRYDPIKDTATFEIYLINSKTFPSDGHTTLCIEREAL